MDNFKRRARISLKSQDAGFDAFAASVSGRFSPSSPFSAATPPNGSSCTTTGIVFNRIRKGAGLRRQQECICAPAGSNRPYSACATSANEEISSSVCNNDQASFFQPFQKSWISVAGPQTSLGPCLGPGKATRFHRVFIVASLRAAL
mmetsp:Transcript_17370/g.23230  ORF Transcript_17370/g.23230 Transcript_17370/m.23230 type:complete len:147 (+) Transcript_17370:185-625(+)